MSRMREYVRIVRQATAGERVQIDGEHFVLPRPGGEGAAPFDAAEADPDLPRDPRSEVPRDDRRDRGRLARNASFIPEHADAHLAHIAKGAERAGHPSPTSRSRSTRSSRFQRTSRGSSIAREGMAFTLGAMGSAKTNFYNDAFCRSGWEEVAKEVQGLWVAGNKKAAIAAVPDEMLLQAYLIGTEDRVRERSPGVPRRGRRRVPPGAPGANREGTHREPRIPGRPHPLGDRLIRAAPSRRSRRSAAASTFSETSVRRRR